MSRRFVIGGNWKMQVPRQVNAVKIAQEIAIKSKDFLSVDIFIAPSFNTLNAVGKVFTDSNVALASQNMHYMDSGAFTGEISVDSLQEAGCKYVLLGHSERRRIFQENDEIINLKVKKALEKGIIPVLCIGETAKERQDEKVKAVNEDQLSGSLKNVSTSDMRKIVIAYEPVWAIDNKFLNPGIQIRPATLQEAHGAHQIARNWIENKYGSIIAQEVPIIYGGSMKASNAQELLSSDQIDGGLIGGASLSAETLIPIVQYAELLSKDTTKPYSWEGNTLSFDK